MSLLFSSVLSSLVLTLSPAFADEGMWLPEQAPDKAARLKELGLKLDPATLGDPSKAPLSAIISLGGYCSASFLSADGLVGTNHHCVSDYLGYNATDTQNYPRDGYLARTRADELWGGPGSEVYVVESITDVTTQVLAKIKPRTKDADRRKLINRATSEILAACEAPISPGAAPAYRCRVAETWGGQKYRLIKARVFRDVRLAYAPPESVGSYGGEIDNWMWPRHAGDFSLLRVYVAPDGSPAAYSKDNVPYKPPAFLKVSPDGVGPGDLVMVAGYPGSTSRYALAAQLEHMAAVGYPESLELSGRLLEILRVEAAKGEEAAGRLAGAIDTTANRHKYTEGMLDNFRTSNVVARKVEQEKELEAWINADKARMKKFGPALAEARRLVTQAQTADRVERLLGMTIRYADLLTISHRAVRLAAERPLPDADREPGFQERDLERTLQRSDRLDRDLWLPADRALMAELLTRIVKLEGEDAVPTVDAFVAAHGGVEGSLNALFDSPKLVDSKTRRDLLQTDTASLQRSKDPWVQLALAIEARLKPLREAAQLREGAWLRVDPILMEARQGAAKSPLYPDADNSLRLTYGQVRGYSPRDAVTYLPQTTVRGMVAKAGEYPFNAPTRFLEAAKNSPASRFADPKLGDVPVDFLSDLDTTGGNSGSATLDKDGRLVGFLFDGNYESMSADWLFDATVTRSMHVDIRYALWTLDSVEGASHLITELGL